ncbi:hypothetical protein M5K25_023648 [Dendrobium thyrsiflorum]|uniref:Uncharacterized protein n=1 Tax=Dendrobium thyrsiflorum TaxID=117978 RepID=A0ABD0UFM0_DENTH
MKKMIKDKQKPSTSETIGGHKRGGNPNPFRGRKNPEAEVLKGDDGMSPLKLLSREEMGMGYDRRGVGRREEYHRRCAEFEGRREEIKRRGADFEGRMEEFHRRRADFEGRRGEYNEGFGFSLFSAAYCCFPVVNSKNYDVGSFYWVRIYCVAVHQNWWNRNAMKHNHPMATPTVMAVLEALTKAWVQLYGMIRLTLLLRLAHKG